MLRPADLSDHSYILGSWKHTFQKQPINHCLDPSAYWSMVNKRCEELLSRSKAMVVVSKDNTDFIIGWTVWECDFLHYVVVKSMYRRLGLASMMLRETGLMTPCSVTHWTSDAELIDPEHKRFLYHPSKMRRKARHEKAT